MKERMNISFTINEAYVKYLATAMISILQNADADDGFCFYIINSGLSVDSKRKIEALRMVKDFDIEYITLLPEDFPPIPDNSNAHVSAETNFRLRIASLKPELDRVLCLDCDLVAVSSLRKLYDIDLNGNYAACAVDAPNFGGCNDVFMKQTGLVQYFNTGVCLIDLAAWRENSVEKKIFDSLRKFAPILRFPDQDLLNLALAGHILELGHQWNVFVGCLNLFYPPEIQKFILENPKIIHWAGWEKPWKYPVSVLADFFWHYARQTPFYEEILFANLQLPAPAAKEKISYTDDYLPLKLRYTKIKLLSKITPGKKRKLYRLKRKELKKELKRIKREYRAQVSQMAA